MWRHVFLLALIAISRQTAPCTSGQRDCSCSDISHTGCPNQNPVISLHVNNLSECILNCDLFGAMVECDYLLYYTQGPYENCKIMASVPFEEYLASCQTIGQPLFDDSKNCFSDSTDICPSETCADKACQSCSSDEYITQCYGFRETQCTPQTPGSKISNITNEDACRLHCTDSAPESMWTYYTYSTSKDCTCFGSGERECLVQAVRFDYTMEEVNNCQGTLITATTTEPITPITSPTTTPTTTTTTTTRTTTINISTPTHVPSTTGAMPGCQSDSECPLDQYCSEETGQCTEGCRDQGAPCTTPEGSQGFCNNHSCEVEGDPKIHSIEVATLSCMGCGSKSNDYPRSLRGAVITINHYDAEPCMTAVLDHPGQVDYAGSVSIFDDKDTLGGCYYFPSENWSLLNVLVEWEGGDAIWTPGYIKINWGNGGQHIHGCCYNIEHSAVGPYNQTKLYCNRC